MDVATWLRGLGLVRRPFNITHLSDHLRAQPMNSTQHQWRAEPTIARRRLSADAQVRALPSQKCQRRRLDAGLDSFRRIENASCRVFGPKEVDRHVEHHHVRCGDASRRPRFEKRARCRISLGWAVRELEAKSITNARFGVACSPNCKSVLLDCRSRTHVAQVVSTGTASTPISFATSSTISTKNPVHLPLVLSRYQLGG